MMFYYRRFIFNVKDTIQFLSSSILFIFYLIKLNLIERTGLHFLMAKNISNYTLHLSLSGLGITLREFLAKFNYFKGFHKAILEKNFFLYNEFFNCSHEARYFSQNFFYHVVQGIWCWSLEVFKKINEQVSL